jgi:acyl-coenzyme A synthetase/AMP-(fatty) acid ligase
MIGNFIACHGEYYRTPEKLDLLRTLAEYKLFPLLIDGFGFGELGSATALKFGLNKYFLLMNGFKAMAIDPNTGKQLPKGKEGVICITSETISDGYYNDPEHTEECFIKGEDGRMYFKSDTLGNIRGPFGRLIELGGRTREYFITGDGKGNFVKVYSGSVENALLSTGIVDNCIVVQSDNGALPTPVAYISIKNDCNLTESEINNFIREKCEALEEFAKPTEINIVDEIKRTPAEKKDYNYYRELRNTREKSI